MAAVVGTGCAHVRSSVDQRRAQVSAEVEQLPDLPVAGTFEVLALIEPKHELPRHVSVDLAIDEARAVGANAVVIFSTRKLVPGPTNDAVLGRVMGAVAASAALTALSIAVPHGRSLPSSDLVIVGADLDQPADVHEEERMWANALFVTRKPAVDTGPAPSDSYLGGRCAPTTTCSRCDAPALPPQPFSARATPDGRAPQVRGASPVETAPASPCVTAPAGSRASRPARRSGGTRSRRSTPGSRAAARPTAAAARRAGSSP